MNTKRKIFDYLKIASTILSTAITVLILVGILLYVFIKGMPSLNKELITNNYNTTDTLISVKCSDASFTKPEKVDGYFSEKYGIAVKDSKTAAGEACVVISYISSSSPFKATHIANSDSYYKAGIGNQLGVLKGFDSDGILVFGFSSDGAEEYVMAMDQTVAIDSLMITTSGGGIKGSLKTTLILIGLTLLFALPLGIFTAIYLTLYAKEGIIKHIIITMIDMTSGIPSIIFGFCGMIIFIPFVSLFSGSNTYSVLAGSLTMTIVLLPTIVKTTIEAINVVPTHYMMASLALGASKTQTIFKVIIPNSIPGILTAVLLAVGRIIGESAALIFVMGTAIKDDINIFEGATSLAVHIWSITQVENPNYNVACAISIIILVIVFILSIVVKIISYRITKKGVGNGK